MRMAVLHAAGMLGGVAALIVMTLTMPLENVSRPPHARLLEQVFLVVALGAVSTAELATASSASLRNTWVFSYGRVCQKWDAERGVCRQCALTPTPTMLLAGDAAPAGAGPAWVPAAVQRGAGLYRPDAAAGGGGQLLAGERVQLAQGGAVHCGHQVRLFICIAAVILGTARDGMCGLGCV